MQPAACSSPCIKHTAERSVDVWRGSFREDGSVGLGHGSSCSEQFAGIHLSWALASFTFLPQDNTPCHSDKAALLRHLTWSGHSRIEASAPIALMCVSGVLWYLLCAQDGSSSSFPHLLHMLIHTLQAVQCISREQKVFAKNIYAEVICGLAHINPVAAVTQHCTKKPLSRGAHRQFYTPQVTKRQSYWLFNQTLGIWGLDIQFRCQILSGRLCWATFSCLSIQRWLLVDRIRKCCTTPRNSTFPPKARGKTGLPSWILAQD